MTKIPFKLADTEDSSKVITGEVIVTTMGIAVRFDGFTDCASEDSQGEPVWIENQGGNPTVYLWDDVNEEEPSHKVSLEYAADGCRETDQDRIDKHFANAFAELSRVHDRLNDGDYCESVRSRSSCSLTSPTNHAEDYKRIRAAVLKVIGEDR